MFRLSKLLTTATIFLTGCLCQRNDGLNSAGSHEGKKVMVYTRENAYRSLDPIMQFDSSSADVIGLVYDRLVEYHYTDRPYRLIPGLLAKMPERTDEPLVFKLTLQPNIFFHEDPCFKSKEERRLTTDDVLYTIRRFSDANQNALSYMLIAGNFVGFDEFHEQSKTKGKGFAFTGEPIEGLERIDDRTFKITLRHDNPHVWHAFASKTMSIVSRRIGECYEGDFARHPVGSGPYQLDKINRRGTLRFLKNQDYFQLYPADAILADGKDYVGRRLPLLDEIHMPLVEEQQPRMLAKIKGDLDFIRMDKDTFAKIATRNPDGSFALTAEYQGQMKMSVAPYLSSDYLSVNMKDPILGGMSERAKHLRKALAYAFDVKGYVDLLRNGRGIVLRSIIPAELPGSQREIDLEGYPHNLEMARKHLELAGYPGGKGLPELTIEFRAATAQVRQDLEFHRRTLEKVGIKIKGSYQTFSAFLKKVEQSNFQLAREGWFADYPDPENFLQLLYSKNTSPGPNHSLYRNEAYDKLYLQMKSMENSEERLAIIKQLHEILAEDLPVIPIWNLIELGLYSPWVKNFKRHVLEQTSSLKYVDVDNAMKLKRTN